MTKFDPMLAQDKKYVPHIWEDGARFHVFSYHSTNEGCFVRCSEPNCEENKEWDKYISDCEVKPK